MKNNSGYIGIGTLIVFIATILVAAVCAALLIYAVQLVKQSAETTITTVNAQVSTGLEVIYIRGDRCPYGNNSLEIQKTVQIIELTVRLRPGSPDIDMDHVVIYIGDGYNYAYLTLAEHDCYGAENANATAYSVKVVRDTDKSFAKDHIITDTDLITIFINVGHDGVNLTVKPEHKAIIKILPLRGIETYEELIMIEKPTRYVEII